MELLIEKRRLKLNITFLTQKYYCPVLHFCYFLINKRKIEATLYECIVYISEPEFIVPNIE